MLILIWVITTLQLTELGRISTNQARLYDLGQGEAPPEKLNEFLGQLSHGI